MFTAANGTFSIAQWRCPTGDATPCAAAAVVTDRIVKYAANRAAKN